MSEKRALSYAREISFKRENWNHRYRVVARSRGKFISHVKYEKRISMREYVSRFSATKTFHKEKELRILKTRDYDEYVDYSEHPRKPSAPFRYFIEFKYGKEYGGVSSRTEEWPSIEDARNEAYENFSGKVWYMKYGGYDYEDEEIISMMEHVDIIREGVIYYR